MNNKNTFSKSDVSNWETVTSFVATYPSDDGEGACDVAIQIGEAGGQWFVRTTDHAGGEDDADDDAYGTRDAAIAATEDLIACNEAEDGEAAEDYLTRRIKERAGEPDPHGMWCVYWETSLDDSGPRERYETEEAATCAANLANVALRATHPGHLLCGFSVRELVDGEWVDGEWVDA